MKKNKRAINNHYPYWLTVVGSFFLPDIYVDAVKRWQGFGGIYIMMLSFILSVPLTIQFVQNTQKYFSEYVEPSVQAMPALLIRDGKVSIAGDEKDGIAKKQVWIWPSAPTETQTVPFFVINTYRTIKSFEFVPVPILITKDAVRIQMLGFIQRGKPLTDVMKIPSKASMVLTKHDLLQMAKRMKDSLIYNSYAYFAWTGWGAGLVFAFLLALVGKVAVLFLLKWKLKLSEAIRLSCVAITPPCFLLVILAFFHGITQTWIMFSVIIYLFYYLFGARASCEVQDLF